MLQFLRLTAGCGRPYGSGRLVAVVAQLVRASVCGTEGRGFKSRRPPHFSSRIIGKACPRFGFDAHEGVHVFSDRASGLRAIIAIH